MEKVRRTKKRKEVTQIIFRNGSHETSIREIKKVCSVKKRGTINKEGGDDHGRDCFGPPKK